MPSFATSPAVGESVNDEEPSAVFVVGFGFGYVRGLLAVSAVVDGDADYFGTGVFDGDEKAVAVLAAGRLCRMEGVGSVQAHRGVTSRETAHSRYELRD